MSGAATEQLRLRQICLAAPELEPAAAAMADILGLAEVHRDPRVGVFGLENVLFVAGTTFLEIVAPTRDGTAVGRFLERGGGQGGYIAIFDCPDPKRRQANAAAIGVATAYTIDRPDYVCVQLHPRGCRAAMLEFDRTEGGEELTGRYNPAGGDGWQQHIDTSRTRGIWGIEAESGDPAGLARHWGAILERPVGPDLTIHLDGGAIRFASSADGGERLMTIVLDAADPAAIMAAAERLGVATGENQFSLSGMTFKLGWDA